MNYEKTISTLLVIFVSSLMPLSIGASTLMQIVWKPPEHVLDV